MNEIPIEMLKSLIEHDPLNGTLVWKRREGIAGWSKQLTSSWNGRLAGKPALNNVDSRGYKSGKIFCRYFSAHRVMWALVNESWPDGDLDHINHVRHDNRIENLRLSNKEINGRNQSLPSTNTSGIIGVSRSRNRWIAFIRENGKHKTLGYFLTIEEAAYARKQEEIRLGYHNNHGSRRLK